MVGGVSPAKAGSVHLGLPVFANVSEVGRRKENAYASTIYELSDVSHRGLEYSYPQL